MSSSSENDRCERLDLVAVYSLAAVSPAEAKSMEAHLTMCTECQQEYRALTLVTSALSTWRTQSVPSPAPLWSRLAERIAGLTQKELVAAPASAPASSTALGWPESPWREVAPGITCKLLSTDVDRDRVSMRLARGIAYPPHDHASVEELYLLDGELWIDDRKLYPGDYNRAEPGTSDQHVWSPTGCMCLLITSPSDQLR